MATHSPFQLFAILKMQKRTFFLGEERQLRRQLRGFYIGHRWSPLRRRCIGQKLRPWKRRRFVSGWVRGSWGFAMSRIGRIQNLEKKHLSFPKNKTWFWVPHSRLGLLLSEVFLKQRCRVFVRSINEGDPIHYGTNIISQITSSHHVMCILMCMYLFCTNYPKPIEIHVQILREVHQLRSRLKEVPCRGAPWSRFPFLNGNQNPFPFDGFP